MQTIQLTRKTAWAPSDAAMPRTVEDEDGRLTIAGNGTRRCCGGHQLEFSGIVPGKAYRIDVEAEHQGLEHVRESLFCMVFWTDTERLGNGETREFATIERDFLLPCAATGNRVRFSRTLTATGEGDRLTIRLAFRWTGTGTSVWSMPRIEETTAQVRHGPVGVCVVTGHSRPAIRSMQDNIDYYAGHTEAAATACRPGLAVLPEAALAWGMNGRSLAEKAVRVPGPETEVFATLAMRHRTHIALGLVEAERDALFNSMILIDPSGSVVARYRKVHLAECGEWDGDLLPGDSFPVVETAIGRVGFNICMDSSCSESSRMVGLNGADFLAMGIMGDLRANSLVNGEWRYDPEKWKAIMRTRAMDNKLCMAVARNTGLGSCIVDHRGDVLAWNDGAQDFISAEVDVNDDRFRGMNQRDIVWIQRRPWLYPTFAAAGNYGSLEY